MLLHLLLQNLKVPIGIVYISLSGIYNHFPCK